MAYTKEIKLELVPKDELKLVAFSDADFVNDLETRKSRSGWVIKYFGMIIYWRPKNQSIVALSVSNRNTSHLPPVDRRRLDT